MKFLQVLHSEQSTMVHYVSGYLRAVAVCPTGGGLCDPLCSTGLHHGADSAHLSVCPPTGEAGGPGGLQLWLHPPPAQDPSNKHHRGGCLHLLPLLGRARSHPRAPPQAST